MNGALSELPGAEFILPGLEDVRNGRLSVPACLVWIAAPRLLRAGLLLPGIPPLPDAELALYRLLKQEGGNAYGRYNALLRRLVSFERALGRWEKRKSGEQ